MSAESQPQQVGRAGKSKPLLFISHRHADRAIADHLREFVGDRTGDSVAVHQSSSVDARAPKIGHNINRQLVSALLAADVLVLIYTGREGDWDYCMWECGVATYAESAETNVIVLQCGRQLPRVFADQVAVDIRDPERVRGFVNSLLTDPDFFPSHGKAITEFQANDTGVRRAADALFTELQKVLRPDDGGQAEEWHAIPFLRLELSAQQVEQIAGEMDDSRAQAIASELLLKARVLEADREAAGLFGRPTLPSDEPFGQVFKRTVSPGPRPDWLEGLAEQVTRAAQWNYPTVRWRLMRSANENDQAWYSPVLTHVMRSPNKAMQLDVHFHRFSGPSAGGSISLALPVPATQAPAHNGAPAEASR